MAVFELERLSSLYLSNNRLASLGRSEHVRRLAGSLQLLTAAHNRLVDLPDAIGELKLLAKLDVSFNRLVALPPRSATAPRSPSSISRTTSSDVCRPRSASSRRRLSSTSTPIRSSRRRRSSPSSRASRLSAFCAISSPPRSVCSCAKCSSSARRMSARPRSCARSGTPRAPTPTASCRQAHAQTRAQARH
jgi:hypothetical protein